MRLWTIQDPRVWEVLRETGHFRADGRRVYKWFRPAYRWMVGQMERRLPGYHKGRYPVWAWHTPKPDMRMSGYRLAPGEEGVRLTLEIPDGEAADRVLLSGFDAWGWHALNNWYLWLSDEEYEWWTDLAGEHRHETQVPGHLQEMIHRSWERVFDLKALDEAARMDPEVYATPRVQATFGEIRLDDVVRVERLRTVDLKQGRS